MDVRPSTPRREDGGPHGHLDSHVGGAHVGLAGAHIDAGPGVGGRTGIEALPAHRPSARSMVASVVAADPSAAALGAARQVERLAGSTCVVSMTRGR